MSSPKPKAAGLVYYPGAHRYKLDGAWVPGVTTIIGVLNKPAIPKWAASEVAEFVADNEEDVAALRRMGRGPMVAALKGIPWQKRDSAAARGTKFHAFAEQILLGHEVEVPPEQVGMVESALQFMEDYKIEPTMVECVVGSRTHHYAGTADLFAQDAIWDWKSGKRIYASTAFQLAAYAGADFYLDAEGKEQSVPHCEAAWGVHIKDDGYDVYPLRFGPDVFTEFVNIRESFQINKRAEGDWKIPGTGYVGIALPHNTEDVS